MGSKKIASLGFRESWAFLIVKDRPDSCIEKTNIDKEAIESYITRTYLVRDTVLGFLQDDDGAEEEHAEFVDYTVDFLKKLKDNIKNGEDVSSSINKIRDLYQGTKYGGTWVDSIAKNIMSL